MTRPTALYRFFAADNSLLYVGITHRLDKRFKEHRLEKPWEAIARIELEHYETREEASSAEQRAIASENPEWNVVHASRRHVPVTAMRHSQVSHDDQSARLRYHRFKAWPDLGRLYPDMCSRCDRFSSDDLTGGTFAWLMRQQFGFVRTFVRENKGGILIEYRCPQCGHVWTCWFAEEMPLSFGADPSVLEWVLSLFPRGTSWDRDDVWMLV